MAPQPIEQTGESTAGGGGGCGGGDAHRSLPTPFLTKTYQLVDDPSVDDVISWNEDGSTFIVWRPAEFARDLLPKYFKHNNFSSFVRQLNTYGFRKIVPDRWEFANDCFRRGEKRLLCDIHRRKISPTVTVAGVATPVTAIPAVRMGSPSNSGEEQVLSSNSPPLTVSATVYRPTSCTSASELVDENERLRRENQHLNQELAQMKSLCNNIFVLMTNYANTQQENNNNNNNSSNNGFQVDKEAAAAAAAAAALDFMPVRRFVDEAVAERTTVKTEEETSPRLFGVPIGSKRSRREENEYDGEQEQHQQQEEEQNGSDAVKSEPLDTGSSQQNSAAWMKHTCRNNKSVCN